MMRKKDEYIRRTIQVPVDLEKTIESMAQNINRSFSYMCSVLLLQAVKEKTRKKRAAKGENNTEHYPTDMGESNCER